MNQLTFIVSLIRVSNRVKIILCMSFLLWLILAASHVSADFGTCDKHGAPVHYFFHKHNICPRCENPIQKPEEQHIQAWNKAGLSLYKQGDNATQNHGLSPHGIGASLSLLAPGSEGITLPHMLKRLGAKPEQYAQFRNLMAIDAEHSSQSLVQKNTMAVAKTHLLSGQYKQFIHTQDETLCIHENVDFCSHQAVQQLLTHMNNAICAITGSNTSICFDDSLMNPDMALLLTHFTAFRGRWQMNIQSTEQVFHISAHSTIQAPAITVESEHLAYLEYQGWQAVAIPYESSFEMIAILPPPNTQPFTIPEQVWLNLHQILTSQEYQQNIHVTLPQSILNLEYKLENYFFVQPQTPREICIATANLGAMFALPKVGQYFAKVKHYIHIKTEKREEKSAIQEKRVYDNTFTIHKKINFDRPFLYSIRDKKQKIVRFLGQIYNPLHT